MTTKVNKKPTVIIVGAGTAGSIICSKIALSFDVTVFEKSCKKTTPLLNKIPLLIGLLYTEKNNYIRKLNLEFSLVRKVPIFESNVVGGSSVINGCVHTLGLYSTWERFLKRFNFRLEDMERSYATNFSHKDERNKISLRFSRLSNLDRAFQETLRQFGVKVGRTDIMNEPACGSVVNTSKRIFRSSVSDFKPYRNAKLILNKKVTNLLVDENKKIVGVMADGAEYRADYVILSAGVIGTNQLMLAPVLRASDREKINLDLPVGKGIKDHVNIRINISSDKRIESLNMINGSFSRKVWMLVKHLIGFDTLLIGTGATSSANLDVDGDGVVDTRINLLNFSERGRLGSNGDYFDGNIHGFSFSISSINPLSEGEIELVDGGDCRVRPNYLQNPKDIENINSAIDRCLALLRVSPLSNYVMSIQDEQKILNDREAFLRENSYSGYHLIGGCHRIINENFQVIGVGNLFICDASIFDEFLASNIHTPVVLVADMFSKQFLRLRR